MVLTFALPATAEEHEKGSKAKQMTLTGCLNKGEMDNHYAFTDITTGKKMTVTGVAGLQKHAANHTVKITGSQSAKVFNVTKVEHVSPTCEAK